MNNGNMLIELAEFSEKLQQYRSILERLKDEQESNNIKRERLSKLSQRRCSEVRKPNVTCCMCNTSIKIEDSNSFATCRGCERLVCRNEEKRCCEWISAIGIWECSGCRSSRVIQQKAGEWLLSQLTRRLQNPGPINLTNENLLGLSTTDSDDGQSSTSSISSSQKVKVREFIEELLSTMLNGPLDDVSVGQLMKNESYVRVFHRYHSQLSRCLSNLELSIHQSLSDLPMCENQKYPDSPSDQHFQLRKLLQRILDEVAKLPELLNQSGHPLRPEEHLPYFSPKKYEQLLATAVLNKVVEDYRNPKNFEHVEKLPEVKEANPGATTGTTFDINHNKVPGKSQLNEDNLRQMSLNTNPQGIHSSSSLSESDESYLSDYIQKHTVPLPDLSSDTTGSGPEDDLISLKSNTTDTTWEENWLFKKRKLKTTESAIAMLVPSPTEEVKALIGDKNADEVSDLSEAGSDLEDYDSESNSKDLNLSSKSSAPTTGTTNDDAVQDSLVSINSIPSNEPVLSEAKNSLLLTEQAGREMNDLISMEPTSIPAEAANSRLLDSRQNHEFELMNNNILKAEEVETDDVKLMQERLQNIPKQRDSEGNVLHPVGIARTIAPTDDQAFECDRKKIPIDRANTTYEHTRTSILFPSVEVDLTTNRAPSVNEPNNNTNPNQANTKMNISIKLSNTTVENSAKLADQYPQPLSPHPIALTMTEIFERSLNPTLTSISEEDPEPLTSPRWIFSPADSFTTADENEYRSISQQSLQQSLGSLESSMSYEYSRHYNEEGLSSIRRGHESEIDPTQSEPVLFDSLENESLDATTPPYPDSLQFTSSSAAIGEDEEEEQVVEQSLETVGTEDSVKKIGVCHEDDRTGETEDSMIIYGSSAEVEFVDSKNQELSISSEQLLDSLVSQESRGSNSSPELLEAVSEPETFVEQESQDIAEPIVETLATHVKCNDTLELLTTKRLSIAGVDNQDIHGELSDSTVAIVTPEEARGSESSPELLEAISEPETLITQDSQEIVEEQIVDASQQHQLSAPQVVVRVSDSFPEILEADRSPLASKEAGDQQSNTIPEELPSSADASQKENPALSKPEVAEDLVKHETVVDSSSTIEAAHHHLTSRKIAGSDFSTEIIEADRPPNSVNRDSEDQSKTILDSGGLDSSIEVLAATEPVSTEGEIKVSVEQETDTSQQVSNPIPELFDSYKSNENFDDQQQKGVSETGLNSPPELSETNTKTENQAVCELETDLLENQDISFPKEETVVASQQYPVSQEEADPVKKEQMVEDEVSKSDFTAEDSRTNKRLTTGLQTTDEPKSLNDQLNREFSVTSNECTTDAEQQKEAKTLFVQESQDVAEEFCSITDQIVDSESAQATGDPEIPVDIKKQVITGDDETIKTTKEGSVSQEACGTESFSNPLLAEIPTAGESEILIDHEKQKTSEKPSLEEQPVENAQQNSSQHPPDLQQTTKCLNIDTQASGEEESIVDQNINSILTETTNIASPQYPDSLEACVVDTSGSISIEQEQPASPRASDADVILTTDLKPLLATKTLVEQESHDEFCSLPDQKVYDPLATSQEFSGSSSVTELLAERSPQILVDTKNQEISVGEKIDACKLLEVEQPSVTEIQTSSNSETLIDRKDEETFEESHLMKQVVCESQPSVGAESPENLEQSISLTETATNTSQQYSDSPEACRVDTSQSLSIEQPDIPRASEADNTLKTEVNPPLETKTVVEQESQEEFCSLTDQKVHDPIPPAQEVSGSNSGTELLEAEGPQAVSEELVMLAEVIVDATQQPVANSPPELLETNTKTENQETDVVSQQYPVSQGPELLEGIGEPETLNTQENQEIVKESDTSQPSVEENVDACKLLKVEQPLATEIQTSSGSDTLIDRKHEETIEELLSMEQAMCGSKASDETETFVDQKSPENLERSINLPETTTNTSQQHPDYLEAVGVDTSESISEPSTAGLEASSEAKTLVEQASLELAEEFCSLTDQTPLPDSQEIGESISSTKLLEAEEPQATSEPKISVESKSLVTSSTEENSNSQKVCGSESSTRLLEDNKPSGTENPSANETEASVELKEQDTSEELSSVEKPAEDSQQQLVSQEGSESTPRITLEVKSFQPSDSQVTETAEFLLDSDLVETSQQVDETYSSESLEINTPTNTKTQASSEAESAVTQKSQNTPEQSIAITEAQYSASLEAQTSQQISVEPITPPLEEGADDDKTPAAELRTSSEAKTLVEQESQDITEEFCSLPEQIADDSLPASQEVCEFGPGLEMLEVENSLPTESQTTDELKNLVDVKNLVVSVELSLTEKHSEVAEQHSATKEVCTSEEVDKLLKTEVQVANEPESTNDLTNENTCEDLSSNKLSAEATQSNSASQVLECKNFQPTESQSVQELDTSVDQVFSGKSSSTEEKVVAEQKNSVLEEVCESESTSELLEVNKLSAIDVQTSSEPETVFDQRNQDTLSEQPVQPNSSFLSVSECGSVQVTEAEIKVNVERDISAELSPSNKQAEVNQQNLAFRVAESDPLLATNSLPTTAIEDSIQTDSLETIDPQNQNPAKEPSSDDQPVVVSESTSSKILAEKEVEAVLEIAASEGVCSSDLTSSPSTENLAKEAPKILVDIKTQDFSTESSTVKQEIVTEQQYSPPEVSESAQSALLDNDRLPDFQIQTADGPETLIDMKVPDLSDEPCSKEQPDASEHNSVSPKVVESESTLPIVTKVEAVLAISAAKEVCSFDPTAKLKEAESTEIPVTEQPKTLVKQIIVTEQQYSAPEVSHSTLPALLIDVSHPDSRIQVSSRPEISIDIKDPEKPCSKEQLDASEQSSVSPEVFKSDSALPKVESHQPTEIQTTEERGNLFEVKHQVVSKTPDPTGKESEDVVETSASEEVCKSESTPDLKEVKKPQSTEILVTEEQQCSPPKVESHQPTEIQTTEERENLVDVVEVEDSTPDLVKVEKPVSAEIPVTKEPTALVDSSTITEQQCSAPEVSDSASHSVPDSKIHVTSSQEILIDNNDQSKETCSREQQATASQQNSVSPQVVESDLALPNVESHQPTKSQTTAEPATLADVNNQDIPTESSTSSDAKIQQATGSPQASIDLTNQDILVESHTREETIETAQPKSASLETVNDVSISQRTLGSDSSTESLGTEKTLKNQATSESETTVDLSNQEYLEELSFSLENPTADTPPTNEHQPLGSPETLVDQLSTEQITSQKAPNKTDSSLDLLRNEKPLIHTLKSTGESAVLVNQDSQDMTEQFYSLTESPEADRPLSEENQTLSEISSTEQNQETESLVVDQISEESSSSTEPINDAVQQSVSSQEPGESSAFSDQQTAPIEAEDTEIDESSTIGHDKESLSSWLSEESTSPDEASAELFIDNHQGSSEPPLHASVFDLTESSSPEDTSTEAVAGSIDRASSPEELTAELTASATPISVVTQQMRRYCEELRGILHPTADQSNQSEESIEAVVPEEAVEATELLMPLEAFELKTAEYNQHLRCIVEEHIPVAEYVECMATETQTAPCDALNVIPCAEEHSVNEALLVETTATPEPISLQIYERQVTATVEELQPAELQPEEHQVDDQNPFEIEPSSCQAEAAEIPSQDSSLEPREQEPLSFSSEPQIDDISAPFNQSDSELSSLSFSMPTVCVLINSNTTNLPPADTNTASDLHEQPQSFVTETSLQIVDHDLPESPQLSAQPSELNNGHDFNDQEHIDDNRNDEGLIPGSIAEREHLKWQNASPIANNPYSPDVLQKRLSDSHQRSSFCDFDRLASKNCSAVSLDSQPVMEVEVEPEESKTENDRSLQSVVGGSPTPYTRYGRDYYINDAKRASGSRKLSTNVPAPTHSTDDEKDQRVNERHSPTLGASTSSYEQVTPGKQTEDVFFTEEETLEHVSAKKITLPEEPITPQSLESFSELSTSNSRADESLTYSEDSDITRIYEIGTGETKLVHGPKPVPASNGQPMGNEVVLEEILEIISTPVQFETDENNTDLRPESPTIDRSHLIKPRYVKIKQLSPETIRFFAPKKAFTPGGSNLTSTSPLSKSATDFTDLSLQQSNQYHSALHIDFPASRSVPSHEFTIEKEVRDVLPSVKELAKCYIKPTVSEVPKPILRPRVKLRKDFIRQSANLIYEESQLEPQNGVDKNRRMCQSTSSISAAEEIREIRRLNLDAYNQQTFVPMAPGHSITARSLSKQIRDELKTNATDDHKVHGGGHASPERPSSPVFEPGHLRSSIQFFENLKNK
ncbi:mucin-17-like isoform X4 [Wyeomyia smithii]|uniref:mucin-17-like isoform X4 n=1 Tax=Wyeomyia smithii TaxID=174621 RepID=UPI002467DA78|nr:mucin-17-like isoform X4 [Wyeomyia smithii]